MVVYYVSKNHGAQSSELICDVSATILVVITSITMYSSLVVEVLPLTFELSDISLIILLQAN